MSIYDEDDPHVLLVEGAREWQQKTNLSFSQLPKSVIKDAHRKKAEGVRPQRSKGLKHFRKVGYVGDEMKKVPRWVIGDGLAKVIKH
mmetsp:Transcript_11432/g.15388  ORF Transcript_11432/g.15388 Transcript_11432/m.15388 type:complete len:87 (+) Transcript_11432:508-768(+)|eukprot:CAMPEP_0185587578 /NCGR_PEP_ID=MMETSP0434-20130131/49733_1 /TAXON_ID=626734 ORGANISM="Favella taraikaensis, Strain Fe Narragansett Bay" /NCGR_SAMPLE_ID=MMETSP0434 /ASSEMBLY_ACC=CAM_ASM_000379 /LENGTH=86 /DNA_ID=CAMNT_0028209581 /DNA_START=480 /DNA_END=740 /DNA_ORIENTATION=+